MLEAVRLGAVGYLTKDLDRTRCCARSVACAMATSRCPAGSPRGRSATLSISRRPGVERGTPGLDSLSPREEEILRLLADGMTDREIGEGLTISTRTVETHVSNILRKLDAGTAPRLRVATGNVADRKGGEERLSALLSLPGGPPAVLGWSSATGGQGRRDWTRKRRGRAASIASEPSVGES